jgi:arylformamidase
MPRFKAPWHPHVSIKQLGAIDSVGRETHEVVVGTHTGTHIDAPRHFTRGGKTIDQIPLDVLVGEVSIINLTGLKENQALTLDMFKTVPLSKRIICKLGWGKDWGNSNYYQGYPFFTKEVAQYLISSGVALIGIDTPSPDDSRIKPGSERDSEVHKILLGQGVILLEYLAHLERVKDYNGWHIVAMPLKIFNADGSPARVFIYR